MTNPCPDCGVACGQLHKPGCDVERCPRCGNQMISCDCIYEVCGIDLCNLDETHPDIYKNGPSEEMKHKWAKEWGSRAIPWTGEWPAVAECKKFGWYAILIAGKGWVPCSQDTLNAIVDLNRLYTECRWDVDSQKWVKKPERSKYNG